MIIYGGKAKVTIGGVEIGKRPLRISPTPYLAQITGTITAYNSGWFGTIRKNTKSLKQFLKRFK